MSSRERLREMAGKLNEAADIIDRQAEQIKALQEELAEAERLYDAIETRGPDA